MPNTFSLLESSAHLPTGPGVYQMNDAQGHALYVGKARNLKKRVASYARPQNTRLTRMLQATCALEAFPTRCEEEALLLEANLIKRLKPRFNIRLRDDKSFPQLLLTDHPAPRLMKYRGPQKDTSNTFGPFASSALVDATLSALQRAFLLRSCADHVYENRTRPCLLYQIKRCAAPCTEKISLEDYAHLVEEARAFLSGRSQEVQKRLLTQMETASAALDFERAASCRDRITALSRIQESQSLHPRHLQEADVFALHRKADGPVCVEVFFFRHGQNRGGRAYFPKHAPQHTAVEILEAFITQFYTHRTPAPLLLVDRDLPARTLLAQALSTQHKVRIEVPRRGEKYTLVQQVRDNARHALEARLMHTLKHEECLAQLKEIFALPTVPKRIEVYDNSHIQGTEAVGAMVVVESTGFAKHHYRKFNIKDVPTGDDYAMLQEVLRRRFRDPSHLPDLLLIDGGRGHLTAARHTLKTLKLEKLPLVCIAKGPHTDHFYRPSRPPQNLKNHPQCLYFLQRLRDEAHRFAISAHRRRRTRRARSSPLDAIPGVGPKRKRALLLHFGSMHALRGARREALEAVPGISHKIADLLHKTLQNA